jgi:Ca2+-binding EF-hand superfamily protein
MMRMRFKSKELATTALSFFMSAGFAYYAVGSANAVYASQETNPLSPAFQSHQEAAYWRHVEKMVNRDKVVTEESYIKRYVDLWDATAPQGKDPVTIDEFVNMWASVETQDPTSPQYRSPGWRKEYVASVGLDANHDGTVSKRELIKYLQRRWAKATTEHRQSTTKEAYLRKYEDLWDRNVPPGEAVTIDEFVHKWAAIETHDPLSPTYRSPATLREHALTIDTDHDGTITKEEFLEHMETAHWAEAVSRANARTMTGGQAVDVISTDPLDPDYKPR